MKKRKLILGNIGGVRLTEPSMFESVPICIGEKVGYDVMQSWLAGSTPPTGRDMLR